MRPVLLVCLLAGCDPLASPSYVGEPMFVLGGTLAGVSDDPGGMALMWQDTASAAGPGIAVTHLEVQLEFPAKFRATVPLPPPDAARFAFDDGVELAEAYVHAVADPDAPRPLSRGLDRARVLVWASADVAEGTQAAAYLGGAMTKGYHLRRYTSGAAGEAQRVMIERCAQAATRALCETRRAYNLAPADDAEPLRIVVVRP
jgi:hypothetical protein